MRILFALQPKFDLPRLNGISDDSTRHDFEVGAESMCRVIATATMFGQPARQIFSRADVVPAG